MFSCKIFERNKTNIYIENVFENNKTIYDFLILKNYIWFWDLLEQSILNNYYIQFFIYIKEQKITTVELV